jgi:hypothetical protein
MEVTSISWSRCESESRGMLFAMDVEETDHLGPHREPGSAERDEQSRRRDDHLPRPPPCPPADVAPVAVGRSAECLEALP